MRWNNLRRLQSFAGDVTMVTMTVAAGSAAWIQGC